MTSIKKDPLVFKNALSMKMTYEQFKADIEPTLLLLGYEIEPIVSSSDWTVFATNWNGINNKATFVDELNKEHKYREFIEGYNPMAFLEKATEVVRESELKKIRSGKKTEVEND